MTKYFLTLAVLCFLGVVSVRGEFDKKAAMAKFMAKANECKTEVGATEGNAGNLKIHRKEKFP